MTWTIYACRLNIAGPLGGHLFFQIFNDAVVDNPDTPENEAHGDQLVSQISGLATPKTPPGAEPDIVGSEGDSIFVYNDNYARLHPDYGKALYTGSEAEIDSVLNQYLPTFTEFVRAQQFVYKAVPDASYVNSNSIFDGFYRVLEISFPSIASLLNDAESQGGANPGHEKDIFRGNLSGWQPILADVTHLGYVLRYARLRKNSGQHCFVIR